MDKLLAEIQNEGEEGQPMEKDAIPEEESSKEDDDEAKPDPKKKPRQLMLTAAGEKGVAEDEE